MTILQYVTMWSRSQWHLPSISGMSLNILKSNLKLYKFPIDRVLFSVECYDAHHDVWEYVTPMTCARLGAGVAAYREQLVVAGGYGLWSSNIHHSVLTSVEFYDPKTSTYVHQ